MLFSLSFCRDCQHPVDFAVAFYMTPGHPPSTIFGYILAGVVSAAAGWHFVMWFLK